MRSCMPFPCVSKMSPLTYSQANSVIINNVIISNFVHDIFNFRDTEVVICINLALLKKTDNIYLEHVNGDTEICLSAWGHRVTWKFYGRHHDLVDRYGVSVVTNDHGYVPLVDNSSRSFPHSWLVTGFGTRLMRRVPLVGHKLPTLPERLSSLPVFSGVRVTRSLVLCTFSFCHWVVCSSSIYRFWLPLWYLKLFLAVWWVNKYLRQPSIDFDCCNFSFSGDVIYNERWWLWHKLVTDLYNDFVSILLV